MYCTSVLLYKVYLTYIDWDVVDSFVAFIDEFWIFFAILATFCFFCWRFSKIFVDFIFTVLYIDWDVVDSPVAFTEEFVVAIYWTMVTLHPSYSGHYETRHGKTNTGINAKVL